MHMSRHKDAFWMFIGMVGTLGLCVCASVVVVVLLISC